MYVYLVRRRANGVAIPPEQLRKLQPLKADLHMGANHSRPLGRVSTQAWVFNPTPGPDVIPRLHDARVTSMAQGGLSLTGMEEIDGVLYAQSWWCRSRT
ncbi:hypothetical protein [Pseudomonas monteilii]|uniref:hypothetical protein n=1 Tax=Pseudomonas monteilii TaxID=76759 RepID=UPI0018A9D2B7|nr:hypothetical protein [Pseudomonas monteilii]MBF8746920.1 hypothetical protein [Pseudomonas monteilii]